MQTSFPFDTLEEAHELEVFDRVSHNARPCLQLGRGRLYATQGRRLLRRPVNTQASGPQAQVARRRTRCISTTTLKNLLGNCGFWHDVLRRTRRKLRSRRVLVWGSKWEAVHGRRSKHVSTTRVRRRRSARGGRTITWPEFFEIVGGTPDLRSGMFFDLPLARAPTIVRQLDNGWKGAGRQASDTTSPIPPAVFKLMEA